MNIDTGKIIKEVELEQLDVEDQSRYVPLSQAQLQKYRKLTPAERVGQYRIDIDKHKQKQIEKRRASNKRNKQSKKGK